MAASSFATFGRDLQLATDGLAKEQINPALAAFARAELAKALSSGEASPLYDRYVNGVPDLDESAVEAPGPILYVFRWWKPVLTFALETARAHSPEQSGEYKRGWIILVNDVVTTDFDSIRPDATVILTNKVPYHRSIDVGHRHYSVPAGIVERVRGSIRSQFKGGVTAKVTHVIIPNPYILQGRFRQGVRAQARKSLRRDTTKGQTMTYPAIRIEMVNS